MNRGQGRLAVWALALLTCVAFGGQSAFAWNNQPRVHAEGWFFHYDAANVAGGLSDKVKFGLNGRCNNDGFTTDTTSGAETCNGGRGSLGEYDYHNQFTGLQSHGKVQLLVFRPLGDPDCGALVGATGPAATVKGGGQCTSNCTDSAGVTHTYNFEITVVDDDDTAATSGNPDAVCKVFVNGYTRDHAPSADADPGNQLAKGDVEVTTTSSKTQ